MDLTRNDELLLNDAARRSFRDMADQDYLSARLCYKHKLNFQFLWLSQQAVEKYIKAILLYNRVPVLKLNHNLNKGLAKIKEIPYLELDLDVKSERFIDYLNEQGPNRYFQNSMYTEGFEILSLDRTIWELRRYCKPLNYSITNPKGEVIEMLEHELSSIKNSKSRPYHTFKLFGGYLEKRLKDNKFNQGDILTWKNLFFGRNKKNAIRIGRSMHVTHPTHYMHPNATEMLSRFFKIK